MLSHINFNHWIDVTDKIIILAALNSIAMQIYKLVIIACVKPAIFLVI